MTRTTTSDEDAAVLRARAAVLAVPPPDDERAKDAVLTFRVGTQRYGIDAASVREVRPATAIARLPHAPETLLGMTRVRSGVMPLFDLPRLLGNHGEAAAAANWVIVVDDGRAPALGLAADAVEGVALLDIDALQPAPATTGDTNCARGVLPDGLHMLDAAALLALPPAYQRTASETEIE